MKRKLLVVMTSLSLLWSVNTFATDYSDPAIVKSIQEALNNAGYDCGTPDGIAGSGTKSAIASYRADHGLSEGDEIDDELYMLLLNTNEENSSFSTDVQYEFIEVTSDEDISSIPDVKVLAQMVALQIDNLNFGVCDFISFGNLSAFNDLVTVDAKYITESGKPVIFSGMYSPYNTPYTWEIDYVVNENNSHYYYLSEVYEGEYDVYDYTTETIITPAAELILPTEEETAAAQEKKNEIENATKSIIESDIKDTDIDYIEINQNPEGNYIVLPHLVWNVKNSKSLTNKMLDMYSVTIAKKITDLYQEIDEVAIFWKVPYISDTEQAKFQYYRQDGVMYIGDTSIGWGE